MVGVVWPRRVVSARRQVTQPFQVSWFSKSASTLICCDFSSPLSRLKALRLDSSLRELCLCPYRCGHPWNLSVSFVLFRPTARDSETRAALFTPHNLSLFAATYSALRKCWVLSFAHVLEIETESEYSSWSHPFNDNSDFVTMYRADLNYLNVLEMLSNLISQGSRCFEPWRGRCSFPQWMRTTNHPSFSLWWWSLVRRQLGFTLVINVSQVSFESDWLDRNGDLFENIFSSAV
jgi:hypothetical protein